MTESGVAIYSVFLAIMGSMAMLLVVTLLHGYIIARRTGERESVRPRRALPPIAETHMSEDKREDELGLDRETIDRLFPVEPMRGRADCVVCLSSIEDQEGCRRLHCQHTFHPDCIDEWWSRATSGLKCPVCRYVLLGFAARRRVFRFS